MNPLDLSEKHRLTKVERVSRRFNEHTNMQRLFKIHRNLGLSFDGAEKHIREKFRAFRQICIELIEAKISSKDFVKRGRGEYQDDFTLKNESLSKDQFFDLLKKIGGLS